MNQNKSSKHKLRKFYVFCIWFCVLRFRSNLHQIQSTSGHVWFGKHEEIAAGKTVLLCEGWFCRFIVWSTLHHVKTWSRHRVQIRELAGSLQSLWASFVVGGHGEDYLPFSLMFNKQKDSLKKVISNIYHWEGERIFLALNFEGPS